MIHRNAFIFLIWPIFRGWDRKPYKFFVGFLIFLKTSKFQYLVQACRSQGGGGWGGAMAIPYFCKLGYFCWLVNPNSTRRADYAHQVTTGFSDLPTYNKSCCCPVQKHLHRKAELVWQVSRYLWRGLNVDFVRTYFFTNETLGSCPLLYQI